MIPYIYFGTDPALLTTATASPDVVTHEKLTKIFPKIDIAIG